MIQHAGGKVKFLVCPIYSKQANLKGLYSWNKIVVTKKLNYFKV